MKRVCLFLAILVAPAFVLLRAGEKAAIARAEPPVSSGGNYAIEGTLGPLEFSTASGGVYSVDGGSFTPILIVETSGAPSLKIQLQGTDIVITWSADIDAFKLEQTTGLGSAWLPLSATQQSSGGEIKVTVPVGAQNQFLRLKSATP